MDAPRPDGDRHQTIRTGLAAVRLAVWLAWLIWLAGDHDATR
ncbi:hypothetical protein [Planobispora rosea]|nr:hypothetical protein [Planobispora rosea]